MELSRALELYTEYAGEAGIVKVDKNGYICLNDMERFFPSKRIDNWLANQQTKDLITVVERTCIIPNFLGIIAKRGKGGGTYAHELIAMDFAMWLSPEFRVKVYYEYMNGTQRKENWNIKRIMAANNYKIMGDAIQNKIAHAEHSSGFEYSNEARMLNTIVFGKPDKEQRDTATEAQLDAIAYLEGYNAAYIDAGMEYKERKDLLARIYTEKYQARKGLIA